jgi:SAM-dependent methyltransferase
MVSTSIRTRFYPDESRDGEVAFYGWVRRFTTRQTILLNLGAGPPAARGAIRVLKGEVARVVGADIDPEVMHNTTDLDEAHVIDGDGVLPFPDDTFDLVLSDWVVEHVEKPAQFLREVRRVLKPGSSFFMRTPNKRHYVGLIARTTPEWFHRLVANWARGYPSGAHEPWPTYYRLNCRSAVESAGRKAGFSLVDVQMWEPPPHYLVFNAVPFMVGVGYERVVNRYQALSGLRANIHCRMIK